MIHLEILSFVYQWYYELSPSCSVNYFNPVSSIHSNNTRQSQNDNLFVKCSYHSMRHSFSKLHWYQPLEFFIY